MLASDGYAKPWPLFWAAAALALAYLAAALARRWRDWRRGLAGPEETEPDRRRVAAIFLAEVLAQRQLRQLSATRWAAHLGIAWGFAALCLLSAAHVLLGGLEAAGLAREQAAWLLRGGGAPLLKAWGNAFGLVLLAGLLLALARRLVGRAPSAPESREADTPLVLALLLLTLSGFALEALRLGAAPAGAPPGAGLQTWLTALWTLHGLGGLALVAWLPHSGLMHALLAPLVIALNARAEHARRDLYWPKPPKLGAAGSPKA